MTEIPEHLLKRSQAAKSAADGGAGAPAAVPVSDDDGQTIPRSLLEQSQQSGASAPSASGNYHWNILNLIIFEIKKF